MADIEGLRGKTKRMALPRKLYKALKEELTAEGCWKNKVEGKIEVIQ